MFEIVVLTMQKILFEGRGKSVILPGERGTLELLPYHKPLLSRLVGGEVDIDGKIFKIRRGIVKVALNKVIIIVEEK